VFIQGFQVPWTQSLKLISIPPTHTVRMYPGKIWKRASIN
jgi:hypothetical protein